jgi:hypothetical protein
LREKLEKSAMSISLDSLVGELQIIAGMRQSATPATHVATAPRRAARGRSEDTLYVLADLSGAASGVLGDLIQAMLNAYWSTPGSVTAALRAAITAGGEWLMDRNVNTPAPDRQSGGLSCVVLRGSEVVIAQAGPASAYVAQHGTVLHYPAADAGPLLPLGVARANDVRFARVELQPGDVIALTDARWATRVPVEAVASAIVSVSVAQALTNLAQLTGSDDLIAIAIEAAGAATSAAPIESPAPTRPTVSPIEAAARSRPTPEPAPTPIEQRATTMAAQPKAAAPKIEPRVSAPPITAPKSAPANESKPDVKREAPSTTAKAWLGALFQGARRGAGSVGTAGQMVVQRTLPEPTTPRGRAGSASRGRSATRSSSAARSGSPSTVRPINAPLLAGIAIAIPILVSLVVATLFIQGSAKAELDTRLATAQNAITLAGQRTGAEARVQWQLAIAQATEALGLDPKNTTASDQLVQAQLGLDRLDNVIRLKPVELWKFNPLGQHRLASQGFNLFVLDRGTNEIDRIALNAAGDALVGNEPEKVLWADVVIDRRPSGNLLDMTWLNSSESRSTASLIVALQGGLMEYNLAFGWKTLDFGTNTVPNGMRRLRSFNGNLYMLDPAASQVWRYSPKGDGYADKSVAYFEQPAPIAAKGIDLVIDGSVYIITGDGQITKYLGGKPEAFQVSGLPAPLAQLLAAAVDVNSTNSSIYLVVPGGLVQLRPDGKFVRQFRATGNAFDTIEDLLIDEQNGRVFVISRGVLYTAALPPIQ